ncbi:hypothetical protein ACH4VS_25805 [Streptomyces hygroscopicus]|nr:hypothetical protein [Streptomyces hygroscopicus]
MSGRPPAPAPALRVPPCSPAATDFGRLFEYGLGLLIGGLRARH